MPRQIWGCSVRCGGTFYKSKDTSDTRPVGEKYACAHSCMCVYESTYESTYESAYESTYESAYACA
eukprot:6214668-Pleurochrysis_carterae.AAC.3